MSKTKIKKEKKKKKKTGEQVGTARSPMQNLKSTESIERKSAPIDFRIMHDPMSRENCCMSHGTRACVRMSHVRLMHSSGSQIVEFTHCALRFWELTKHTSTHEELDWSIGRLYMQLACLARASSMTCRKVLLSCRS